MKSIVTTLAAISISTLLTVPQASAAVSLVVDNGILMGAKGVDVGGTLFDVEFKDGSCDSLFNNCSYYNFPHISSFPTAASTALIAQVFVTSLPNSFRFDAYPQLTAGCEHRHFIMLHYDARVPHCTRHILICCSSQ